MKKLLLFILISAFCFSVKAQKQADKWLFGINAALDFTSGNPVVMDGFTHNIPEGCSSVCTASGTLLFYTDGVTVWDTTHQAMPNGVGLMGDISTTQSAIVVPSPSNSSQYYIFTLAADGGPNGFRYSLVDMTLHGGLGDVTTLNSFIQDSVTEKSAAVKDFEGTGYWIVVHRWGTNEFNSYHLTSAGLQPAVVSNSGIVYTTSQIQNTYGQMKFSACGNKLALAAGYLNKIEVFDFDNSTGMVSNPITLPMSNHIYGIEFSKNSNLLYVSRYGINATLLQYDISLTGASAILASAVPLSVTSDIYALQRASNGKIYVVKSFSQFLGEINSPDTPGSLCNYVDMAIDLDPHFVGNSAALGLPGFMVSYINPDVLCSSVGITEPSMDNNVSFYPNPASNEFQINNINFKTPAQFEIYDFTGRLVEKINSVFNGTTFGKSYVSGIYFIKLQNNNDVQTYRIVKL